MFVKQCAPTIFLTTRISNVPKWLKITWNTFKSKWGNFIYIYLTSHFFLLLPYMKPQENLRPSTHGLVTDIQVNVYIGNTLSRLRFQNWLIKCWRLNYHPYYFSAYLNFSSKDNGSIDYRKDCIVIFIESLPVFMNISKKTRYHF